MLGRLGRNSIAILKQMFLPPRRFDPQTEEAFQADALASGVGARRAAITLTLLVWLSYYGWDLLHARRNVVLSESLPDILALRTVGLVGIVATLAILFLHPLRKALVDNALSGCLTVVYVVSLVMVAEIAFPYNYLFYFICLPLILTLMFGLFRLQSRRVYILAAVAIGASLGVFIFAQTTDTGNAKVALDFPRFIAKLHSYYYLAPALFIVTFALVGCAIAVELERTARAAFLRERELSRKNLLLEASGLETRTKTSALVKAKEELRLMAEEKAAARSRFLAAAAHDLRQPMQALTTLLGAASQALSSEDSRRCRRLLDDAQDAVRLTRNSFNSVLDISRLESGFVEADYSHFELRPLVEEVIANCRPSAEQRGVSIRFRCNRERRIVVRSDRHLLARLISNLLSNAIKYSNPHKGSRAAVTVGIVMLSNRVRLDVIDNGIGIPRSEWERVFQPFVQLDNPERDREKGVGLGLSIVNAITSLLVEHRIDMRSRVGRGTRISLELPIAEGAIALDELAPEQRQAVAGLAGLFVLYVEDDLLVRRSTEALFEGADIVCEAFGSYAELIEKLPSIERAPDLILTDYRLPESMTAADVICAVKAAFELSIPAVVLTGDIVSDADASLGTADRVLRKPVAPKDLLSEISMVCSPVLVAAEESPAPDEPLQPLAPSAVRL